MKKLNNKGFTLIEVLAVVVILGVLATILIFNVGYLLRQNEKNNYNNLKSTILSAAKVYMSDNRYNIALVNVNDDNCDDGYRSIQNFTDSQLTVDTLVSNKLLSTSNIKNPKVNGQVLKNSDSYVIVRYSCDSKDYVYGCFDDDENFDDCPNIGRSHFEWSNS